MKKLLFSLALLCLPVFAQVAPMVPPKMQFFDHNGKPLAGGCLYSYNAGTSTPSATYADSTGDAQNSNPVLLDSSGSASIFLASQKYKFTLYSAGGINCLSGSLIWSQDGVSSFNIFSYPALSADFASVTAGSLAVSGNATVNGNATIGSLTVNGNTTFPSITTQAVNATIYATAGESVAHAVARLPVGGGKVIFDVGVYPSGGVVISTPNVWIEGAGMPNYNSATAPTALTGGTIFQGSIGAIQGADHFVIRNAGVDVGPTWINTQNSAQATNGLAIANNGQVVGAPQIQAPIIENVACLGYSADAAFHCMLVENVFGAYVHNVRTVYNGHGLVLKGQNSRIDGVYSRGHGTDAVILKSDDYAPTSDDTVTNVTIAPLATPGDTKGMMLQGVGAGLARIQVSKVNISGAASWGIIVQGTSNTTFATALSFSDIVIDYLSPSPSNYYCMQYVQFVSMVNINNFQCFNYWAGIAPNLPQANSTNDFSLTNGQFINIAGKGIEAFGRWQIANSRFIANGTGIFADTDALVGVSNNQYASNGADTGGTGTVSTAFKTLSVNSTNGTNMLCSGTLPTVTSGFNTGSIGAGANGPCSFFVTVGSGSAGNTGTIGLPAAANAWNCFASNGTRADHIQISSGTSTSAILTNYGTTFAPTNWTNGDVILLSCFGR